MSILRPYQSQAIEALWASIAPDVNRVAVEMATGLGKTITFAALIDKWLTQFVIKDRFNQRLGPRTLVLVHTDELVRQAYEDIVAMTGGHVDKDGQTHFDRWTVGIVKAGQNDVAMDIIVASVQTLAKANRREAIKDVGLIIVDECHHATARTYMDILAHYGAICGHAPAGTDWTHACSFRAIPAFGFTATLARSDGSPVGHVWQDLAFTRSLTWGMRQGYLVDLIPYTIKIPGLDAGASDAVLDAQLADSIAPEAVVDAWFSNALEVDFFGNPLNEPYPSTLLFAPLVASAYAFADAFNAKGIKAEVVHGAMPGAERKAVLDRYRTGVTTVVCNAMVLTEGVNIPRTKCVIVARPTKSVPLFVQMAGRGLRPWLSAEAPPRASQRCVLLCVSGTSTDLATVANLSDRVDVATDGKSLLAMEDEFDLAMDMPADVDNAYRGPVHVEQWDALVQRSSKAWKYTEGGTPFLPTAKRSQGYVFVVEHDGRAEVWTRVATAGPGLQPAHVSRRATAPDLELAMAMAEDVAQELGGDIGALLADKTRPWRKGVPTIDALSTARRAGVDESAIARILSSKASGKAGKLSDLIDTVTASRVLDRNVQKIKERG